MPAQSSPRNPQAKTARLTPAERKKRFFERQGWIDDVQADRDLSPTARLIGGRIAQHKNLETGQCNPGAGTLAKEAGVAERSAFRAIAELERKGRLRVERTRGGSQSNANSYRLMTPTADKLSGVGQPVRGDKHDIQRVTPCQTNSVPAPQIPPIERPPEGRESKESAEEEFELADPAMAIAGPDSPRDRFQELRGIWQRGWPADDSSKAQGIARHAFGRACCEAEPGAILAGARTWAAAADAPRYLPALPQWLAAHGWEKPPPKKRARGRNGHHEVVDGAEIALEIGGYVEGEDGGLYHPNGDYGSSFDWRASL
jgi:hypothetical protein